MRKLERIFFLRKVRRIFERLKSYFSIALGRPARRTTTTTTTTDKVEDISDVNGPSKFQRISIYERQNLVNLERRGWPVTPWWRGQGGTPNLIKTFWITALRTPGSTEMKIKSFWITVLRMLRSTENENRRLLDHCLECARIARNENESLLI